MEEVDNEEEGFTEELVFDVRSHDGRLPGSSYTAEETLFTWTDVTGTLYQVLYHSMLILFLLCLPLNCLQLLFPLAIAVYVVCCLLGLPAMSEGRNSDDVPVNLETGLLSVVRKIMDLLPDTHVKKVIGPILDQESIVVMANNPSILIRTAVVRVSHFLLPFL